VKIKLTIGTALIVIGAYIFMIPPYVLMSYLKKTVEVVKTIWK